MDEMRADQRQAQYRMRQELIAPVSVMAAETAHVIGAGGLGADVCLKACKLGLAVEAWDGDMVGPENVGVQLFGPCHIGQPKVSATADLCLLLAGAKIVSHNHWVKGGEELAGFVLDCLDSITERENLWRNVVVPRAPFIRRFLSLRMAGEIGSIWVIDPNSPADVAFYEYNALFPPEQAMELPCNGRAVIYANAFVVSLALSLLKKAIVGQPSYRRIDCDLGSMKFVAVE